MMTGIDDDAAKMRIKLRHTVIYLAWSHSPTSLANKPCLYVICDEIDKYPSTSGKREADPISLGRKRMNSYRAGNKAKEWLLSTPTIETGPIWQALTTEAQVIFDYWVRCPMCAGVQLMDFDRIKWPESERSAEAVESGKLAWYACDHCAARWDDSQRDVAVRAGE